MKDFNNLLTLADLDMAAAIAAKALGRTVIRALPIDRKGTVNKVVRVDTVGASVIVRMTDKEDGVREYEKESWCMDQARGMGILCPDVVAISSEGSYSYMVQSYISGKDGDDPSVDPATVWTKLGQYAAAIHTIRASGWGLDVLDSRSRTFANSWMEHLGYNIRSLTSDDELIRLGVLNPAQSRKIKDVFEEMACREFHIGLNHGDLAARNAIVCDTGTVFLLDWGCARTHIVPLSDLCEILRWQNPTAISVQSFLQGYGISPIEFDALQPDLESLTMLTAIDTLRWAVDHNHESLERYIQSARRAVKLKLGEAAWAQEMA